MKVSLAEPYQGLYQHLLEVFTSEQLIHSEAKTLAYGTDASFYRLIPKLVVSVNSLKQLQFLLSACQQRSIPYTFRAAGTSLSGQAISDSVLILLSSEWKQHQIHDDGERITLQPGVIGADANRYLAPFQRKIGPDPASINSCKIGGIVANNASGMCCGTANNSYQTIASMKIVLGDGTILDTASEQSIESFKQSHSELVTQLTELAQSVQNDQALSLKIKHKYRLKNTTGYSLNALVDFSDPIKIIEHLMVGSEGTLGFIAEVSYRTVVEHPYKASALIAFADIETASHAVQALAKGPAAAVELMDRRALASVELQPALPKFIQALPSQACALLVETHASDESALSQQIDQLNTLIAPFEQLNQIAFTTETSVTSMLWGIRKGMFPAVGAVRQVGSTVIIEDVAFPLEHLAQGLRDLQQLFTKYAYHEAIIFGHALDGNLHFVFTQSFDEQAEIDRYDAFMQAVTELVAVKYQGSLKAEHGTGRNMAPFVLLEWGDQAYAVMQQIKQIFDPQGLINPGVILNADNNAHLEHLKPLPAADDLIDRCIECGFCEAVCPSRELSFTPRQRIVLYRELAALKRETPPNQARIEQLEKDFQYLGVDTCAAVGLCADRCPVGINTGDLIRQIRSEQYRGQAKIASWTADHFGTLTGLGRIGLKATQWGHRLLGTSSLSRVSASLHRVSKGAIPAWHPYWPKASRAVPVPALKTEANKVVYFPSCAARTMGESSADHDQRSLMDVTISVLNKAGYQIIIPDKVTELCCGLPYHSKGFSDQSEDKSQQLEKTLMEASDGGRWPVLMDTSPCAKRSIEQFGEGLTVYEPIGFIASIIENLTLTPLNQDVMLHLTCSSRRLGKEADLLKIAERCANKAIIPENIYCCGWAGDKGFTTPELNKAALSSLAAQVPKGCQRGYSNSRTCEIGLSLHSGIPYQSILYLVDQALK